MWISGLGWLYWRDVEATGQVVATGHWPLVTGHQTPGHTPLFAAQIAADGTHIQPKAQFCPCHEHFFQLGRLQVTHPAFESHSFIHWEKKFWALIYLVLVIQCFVNLLIIFTLIYALLCWLIFPIKLIYFSDCKSAGTLTPAQVSPHVVDIYASLCLSFVVYGVVWCMVYGVWRVCECVFTQQLSLAFQFDSFHFNSVFFALFKMRRGRRSSRLL